jgi:CHAD domain-containing protein
VHNISAFKVFAFSRYLGARAASCRRVAGKPLAIVTQLPDGISSKAQGCVHLIQNNRKAAAATDPEPIHIMRIELTRLRAAVLFFSPMTDDDDWSRIDKKLRWLNSALGKARDQDVTANYARR